MYRLTSNKLMVLSNILMLELNVITIFELNILSNNIMIQIQAEVKLKFGK